MATRKDIKESNQGVIPSLKRYELLEYINKLDTLRNKALVCILYLTGCRIEEIVRYKGSYLLKKNKKDPGKRIYLTGEPVRKNQIEFRDSVIIFHNIRSLKLKKRRLNRSIPITVNAAEQPFIKIMTEYLDTLQEDDVLFTIKRIMAYKILTKVGLFPHWLRHIRLTNLTTDYNFGELQLKQFTGWATTDTAKLYVHLNFEDLIDKMEKFDKKHSA